jgi:hypothetical protein
MFSALRYILMESAVHPWASASASNLLLQNPTLPNKMKSFLFELESQVNKFMAQVFYLISKGKKVLNTSLVLINSHRKSQ